MDAKSIWEEHNKQRGLNLPWQSCEPVIIKTDEGRKNDEGKIRWDLVPLDTIQELAKVLTMGANKYGDNNWQKVQQHRYLAALLRHLTAWQSGEKVDSESGLNHLAHVLANVVFMLWQDK